MRHACLDGFGELPVGEFHEYSPTGDCQFISLIAAGLGLAATVIGANAAKKQAKAQTAVASSSQLDFDTLKEQLNTAVATNATLSGELQRQSQAYRLSNTPDRAASLYAPIDLTDNEKVLALIAAVALVVYVGKNRKRKR